MGAPAEFVVIRHILTHPDDTPAEVAKHCSLRDATVRAALKRLLAADLIGHEGMLLDRLRHLPRRIKHRQYTFRAPNADQFLNGLEAPFWLSGEYAAAMDGYDLVPERAMLYIDADDLPAAVNAAQACYAKIAPASKSNIVVKLADPWLDLNPNTELVERGQRLLDYLDSHHIQLLRELSHA